MDNRIRYSGRMGSLVLSLPLIFTETKTVLRVVRMTRRHCSRAALPPYNEAKNTMVATAFGPVRCAKIAVKSTAVAMIACVGCKFHAVVRLSAIGSHTL